MSSMGPTSGPSRNGTRPPAPSGSNTVTHQGSSAGLRVQWIADALHRLSGRPAASVRLRGGVVRVTLRIESSAASAELTMALLRVLSRGDRFGHSTKAGWERIWAEVDQTSEDKVPTD